MCVAKYIHVIVLLWISTIVEASEDKTLNLKIGFDLTQGENGAPSLRIREFDESSENNPRTFDDEAKGIKNYDPAVRADTLSDSDKTKENLDNVSRDTGRENSDEEYDYNDDDGNRIRSTKGLSPGEYEPEENPKIHESYREEIVSDTEGKKRKRRKRDIGKNREIKQRGIKHRSARKQGVSWF